jgi:VCBS repeat protein
MNHPTHFRKITILRFVLAGLVLLFSVPALFADGIASRYPNDVGIENDPDVLLYDNFESYTSPSQLLNKWDIAVQQSNLRIATEPGNFFAGHKALEMKLPIASYEQGNQIAKLINPEERVLYVRTYMKFDPNYNVDGRSNHNGILMSGNYPGPGSPPPRDGSGFFLFQVQNNYFALAGENRPGDAHIYAYWPFQSSNFGDHWYPDGHVIPGTWGLWVTQPANYPDWRSLPKWQPLRGVWYCYEFMVKVNDLGQRNGEVAFWVNGELKGRWPDLFIRSIDTLKIDRALVDLHAGKNTLRVNKKWYDNVVIARSYIGPISPPKPISMGAVADFNSDGSPDYVLQNTSTRQTAIWYLNNNVFVSAAYGPTLPAGWNVIDVADFNLDGNLDYALFNASTRQTAIWYLSGPTFVGGHFGPTLPSGWTLLATADFSGDGKPDYVLYNGSTRRTAVWYMNNNVFTGGIFGPTLPGAWRVVGVADFDRNGNRDYLLFNPSTHQTAIWYLSGTTFVGGAYGPTLPSGWTLLATADFNGDGKPDYVLYNGSTRRAFQSEHSPDSDLVSQQQYFYRWRLRTDSSLSYR